MNESKQPRRNLGVWDSEFLAAQERVEIMEQTRQETNRWIAEEARDERFTDEVTDVDRQMGRVMDRETFRQLVEGLTPRLKVDYHPRLPTMAVKEIKTAFPWERDPETGRLGGVQKIYKMGVGSLQAPVIPEWSLLERKEMLNAAGEKIKIPARVLAHGWRRALVMLVQGGYITRTQAERVIEQHGSGTRPSWQVLMGYKAADGREFVQ